ncbi:MAG: cold shock domain-containing protein [Chlorobiaceae bacterium]|nr:cold shock domain-containing protein [Chlorobiaceae bacterium]
MPKSKVKWFDGKKGYGFIINPEGGEDIFVHFSAICSEQTFKVLNQDAEVEFELDKTQKGLQAKNVREFPVEGGPMPLPDMESVKSSATGNEL